MRVSPVCGQRRSSHSDLHQLPQEVLDAAAQCGVENWACSVEQWSETTSHGESCSHAWWCFGRTDEEQGAHGELCHGCCIDVAKQAVRKGVLPGPRQECRKASAEVAFAASWAYVGCYVGPSAVRSGKAVKHVGCVLRVVGQSMRATQNPHYRQAARFEVAAVMLRPWLFDLKNK